MITINFTIVLELALFLTFLGLANVLVVRPLLKVMDARAGKIEQDKAVAETERQEANRLKTQYVEQLTQAHQEAAQRLHKARYEAYQAGRAELDQLRAKADEDVNQYSAAIEVEAALERRKVEELVAGLVALAEEKINKEGSLL